MMLTEVGSKKAICSSSTFRNYYLHGERLTYLGGGGELTSRCLWCDTTESFLSGSFISPNANSFHDPSYVTIV